MERTPLQAVSCRVFLEQLPPLAAGDEFRLTGEESKYVARVLRLTEGDKVILCAPGGPEYPSRIKTVEAKAVLLTVEAVVTPKRESPLRITLCQSLPKSKKMDLIVQKCTELGVQRFVPFVSSRSISRPEEGEAPEKTPRWGRIALEAARQCGRTFTPAVDDVISFDRLLKEMAALREAGILKLIPWESEERRGLRSLVERDVKEVILLIGPEGGFSAGEVEEAEAAGFIPLSMGPRLLRTETAGLAAVAMLQYLWGDMG